MSCYFIILLLNFLFVSDGMFSGPLVPDEFMNSKKAHEVPAMSEVVASLAKCCRVKQVIIYS